MVFCGFVIVIIFFFLVLYEERKKNHSYYAGRGFDNFSSIFFFGYLAAAVIKTTHIN